MQIASWEKYLTYDWDPELFTAFLIKFPLTFELLVKNIRLAVNHDSNIESIIEQGLSALDDIDDDRTRKRKPRSDNARHETASDSE